MIPTTFDNHYKKTMRNVRTKLALGEYEISVDPVRYDKFKKSKEYKIYKKVHSGKVITGSMALYLFGLLDRRVGDLDVLDSSVSEFDFSHKDSYNFNVDIGGYMGSIEYSPRWYQSFKLFYVDIFEENENNIDKIVYEDIVLDNPLSIMENKYKFGTQIKHRDDLMTIVYKLDKILYTPA